jgi:hypothetical protein
VLHADLEDDDEEEDATGDVDLEPGEHHGHGAQLPQQVRHHEQGGDEPTAAPRYVHVLPGGGKGVVIEMIPRS